MQIGLMTVLCTEQRQRKTGINASLKRGDLLYKYYNRNRIKFYNLSFKRNKITIINYG